MSRTIKISHTYVVSTESFLRVLPGLLEVLHDALLMILDYRVALERKRNNYVSCRYECWIPNKILKNDKACLKTIFAGTVQ